jgi:hypothetical protein
MVLDELVKIECCLIILETLKHSPLLSNFHIKLPSLGFILLDLFFTIDQLMILVSIFPMWPFEINKALDWKLSFAVSTFPVRIMPQAADVHKLSATLIWAQCNLMVRIQNHLAYTVRLQLRDQSLGLIVHSLSEEKHIEVIEALVKIRSQRGQVRETLQRILIGVHEIFEIHHFNLFEDVDPGLF